MGFKISIVVPCYNVEKYIDRCADSIINQTIGIENLQVIFVNDASPDHVEEHLLRYEQQYPDNICIVNLEENGGLSNARNVGMQYAMAEFIAFVDSDDWIEPDMYEKMYNMAVQGDYDIVRCDNDRPHGKGEEVRNRTGEDVAFILDSTESRREYIKKHRLNITAWNKLYKLNLFTENGIEYPNGLLYEDNYATMLLYMKARKIYHIKEVLYHWFVNDNGITGNSERIMDRMQVQILLLFRLKDEGLYECFKEEIDYNFFEKYFAETVYFLIAQDAGNADTINNIKKLLLELVPDITDNVYYKGKEKIAMLDLQYIAHIIVERQVDINLYHKLERKYLHCKEDTSTYDVLQMLWQIKDALPYLKSGDDHLYSEIADCFIAILNEIKQDISFTYEEDLNTFHSLVLCLQNKSRKTEDILNYLERLEDIVTDGAVNAAVYGIGYGTLATTNKYCPGYVTAKTDSEYIGKSIGDYRIESIDSVIDHVDTIIIGDALYQSLLEAHIRIKYKDKKLRIINPFRFSGYYRPNELIRDNYADRNSFSEEEFNQMNENSYNIGPVNSYVDEVFENVPLFQEIEIETVNRCNGVCEFCPVNKHADTREYHWMEEGLFKSIIDQLAQIDYSGQIAPFSNNEPFLDDRIIERTKYMREKLPNARIHMFTNGTLLSVEKLQEIINYLDEIVIDNYHPEHKLLKTSQVIKEYCEQNPDLMKKLTIVIRDPKEVLTSRGGDAPNRNDLKSFPDCKCALPYQQLIIRPDGKVSLCCNDPLGKNTLGDLTKESILDVWYGERYNQVRKALQNGRKGWKHCEYCDTFYIY